MAIDEKLAAMNAAVSTVANAVDYAVANAARNAAGDAARNAAGNAADPAGVNAVIFARIAENNARNEVASISAAPAATTIKMQNGIRSVLLESVLLHFCIGNCTQ